MEKLAQISPSMPSRAVIAIDRAVSDLRRGSMIVVRDSRHGETALVQAAEVIGPDGLAAMVRLTGSQPSLTLTRNRVAALLSAPGEAAIQSFALPVGSSSGFVQNLADPIASLASDPDLKSEDEHRNLSVVQEPDEGLAALSIRIAKFARLLPAMVVARVPGLEVAEARAWAVDRGLLLVDTSDIRDYPDEIARSLSRVADARVPLAEAEDCRIVAFRPADGGIEHLALVIGTPDPTAPVLTRLHSQCLTGDLLASLRCDCGEQLRGAIHEIAQAGGGVVIYLAQEGRDIGLINKLRAYELQDHGFDTIDANRQLGFDDDERVYRPAAVILQALGMTQVRLMTNNPGKLEQLAAHGINVVDRVPHIFQSNDHNAAYLQTKFERGGHLV
ncbi:MAG: GTP cyclohydrolase II [Rhodospirillaceae bacterium]|jgi:GTP cyclohydrolase II|nr:GTP cyclohydrolase II [Rhodospirillaceae bacterium]MBT6136894.1 GTP cyclohydrolase II [Rhodospirillaceae bacterium]